MINPIHSDAAFLDKLAVQTQAMGTPDFVRMLELLHAVNETTGPGACEQQLPDALRAISEYLNSITN